MNRQSLSKRYIIINLHYLNYSILHYIRSIRRRNILHHVEEYYKSNISATSLLLFQTKIYEQTQYVREQHMKCHTIMETVFMGLFIYLLKTILFIIHKYFEEGFIQKVIFQ